MSPATAPPTAHTPRARARRAGSGNASRINAIDAGSMTAAPAPWTQRAAISAAAVGAAPHPSDATPNTAMPIPSAFLAPIRSETVPANSSRDANSKV